MCRGVFVVCRGSVTVVVAAAAAAAVRVPAAAAAAECLWAVAAAAKYLSAVLRDQPLLQPLPPRVCYMYLPLPSPQLCVC